MSYIPPVAGNHNDLFEIKSSFEYMLDDLREIGINPDGLFINTDAGFDAASLRDFCELEGIHLNAPVNPR